MNCRPWIGPVDRSDPWATPELSTEIEVRVIDLLTMEMDPIKYVGHKGLSPSTMCCFIFLDTSDDFVGRYGAQCGPVAQLTPLMRDQSENDFPILFITM